MWQGQVTKNARLKIDKGYTGLSRNQCKYQTFFPDVYVIEQTFYIYKDTK